MSTPSIQRTTFLLRGRPGAALGRRHRVLALYAAGEKVLDVPPKLAARARPLDNGDLNKDDPNDARSVAVDSRMGGGWYPVGAIGPARPDATQETRTGSGYAPGLSPAS